LEILSQNPKTANPWEMNLEYGRCGMLVLIRKMREKIEKQESKKFRVQKHKKHSNSLICTKPTKEDKSAYHKYQRKKNEGKN